MRIAILSAGPSLRLWPEEVFIAYDVRIAVNSACEFIACDWWCAMDRIALERLKPKGDPRIYTRCGLSNKMRNLPESILSRVTMRERFKCEPSVWPITAWEGLSITAALQLACKLGAKQVDVYGHDMDGIVDWRGMLGPDSAPPRRGRKPHNRGPDRWARERRRWRQCLEIARESRVQVRHMVMAEEPLAAMPEPA